MTLTDVSIVLLIIGGLLSIAFNVYQWWDKTQQSKLEKKKNLASIADSEGNEANSMIGLAKLVVGFLNDFKEAMEEKFSDMDKKLTKSHDDLSKQLADHAAKDESNIEEIKNEIAKIAHA